MMVIEYEDQIYDSLFALMGKSEDEDGDKVTILYIKDNLKDYSLKELKSLATVVIDPMFDLTKEKNFLNKDLDDLKV